METCKKDNLNVKLLKLVIKKFIGNYMEYYVFWDSFEVVIYINESLNDIKKLNYLRIYLEGFIVVVIVGFVLIKENYIIVVEFLYDRYGNK